MPASPEDWVAVLDRLLRGDRLAFLEVNRLVTGYLQQLRAWDSIVANARAGRLRDAQAFLAYVRTITRNKFVDRLKRRLRCKEREAVVWDEETARSLATLPDEAGSPELWAAVRTLPPDQQRVLDGIYTQGKTHQEVSDETGIPLGTMKRRLREAILSLRRRFADA